MLKAEDAVPRIMTLRKPAASTGGGPPGSRGQCWACGPQSTVIAELPIFMYSPGFRARKRLIVTPRMAHERMREQPAQNIGSNELGIRTAGETYIKHRNDPEVEWAWEGGGRGRRDETGGRVREKMNGRGWEYVRRAEMAPSLLLYPAVNSVP